MKLDILANYKNIYKELYFLLFIFKVIEEKFSR